MNKLMMSVIIILSLAIFSASSSGVAAVLRIDFDITRNGSISNFETSVSAGRATPAAEGQYTVTIFDSDKNVLWSGGQNLSFFVHDANIEVEKMHYSIKIPYTPNMTMVTIAHNNITLFTGNLELCNSDGDCDSNENNLSCPSDCSMDKEDGICINAQDGICDPDCIGGYDPDCSGGLTCGDGICSTDDGENFFLCPSDCMGKQDDVCDEMEDGACDPDCDSGDPDCIHVEKRNENSALVTIVAMAILILVLISAALSFKKSMRNKARGKQQGGM
ncbi:MAG: hypothetical protein GXO64_03145 [Candidatus Micrarchaeota archaeon]|nr:hypothetical protein [Candidatus Micrarchaeota archaeon]